jgi:IS5 family transposase
LTLIIGLLGEEVSDLREYWMEHADAVLADEDIVAAVYGALAKRHPKIRCRGRCGAPADVVLQLLTLKHMHNWTYEELQREVRANLVECWGVALGPDVLKRIHERIVRSARQGRDRGTMDAH